MKFIRWLMPLGMVSVVAYFIHVFAGQILWKEYNPVTTDISSLTAMGAPDADLLRIFTTIYGVCFLLFAAGMVIRAFKDYHTTTRIGYVIFLIMALASGIGYMLFPLTGEKTEMSFQNVMHIVVTAVTVFTTILSLFFIAVGYLRKEKNKRLGMICLITAVMITIFGALNPVGMATGIGILGLTERLVIFTLQIFVFFLSFIYTFNIKLTANKK